MVAKVENELDFAYLFNVLKRQKGFIFLIFLAFMLFIFTLLLIWPKTYVSESVVQLGSIGTNVQTNNIFDPVAAKTIMESKEVVYDAVRLYNDELKSNRTVRRFNEINLEVELVKEQVGRDEDISNYLRVRVKTSSPELSQKVNKIIVDNFIVYTKKYYEDRLNVYLSDKEQTSALINQLNEDITSAQEAIKRILGSGSSNSASDNLLLSRTVVDSRGQLISAQNRLISIEADLASKREFKVVNEPEVPYKFTSPSIFLVSLAGIVVGLLFSIFCGFLREDIKATK